MARTSTVVKSQHPTIIAAHKSPTYRVKSVDFEAVCRTNQHQLLGPRKQHSASYDACFVGNCFCCDHCVWSPINPQWNDPSTARQPRSRPFCRQFVQNLHLYITILLLGSLDGIFLYFDASFLWVAIHPAVIICSQVLLLLVLITLLTTACTDPGIVTPSTPDEVRALERAYKIPRYAFTANYVPQVRPKEVLIGGHVFKLKYCFTCRFFRPSRTVHCSTCNVCVDTFDHHCPWIGNCVGRRDYRVFFLFLNLLSLLGIYIGACTLAHLILCKYE